MPQTPPSRIGLLPLLFLLSACANPLDSDRPIALTIRNDKPVYFLSTDLAATTFLVNDGSDPVYAAMAEYVAVQRMVDGEWASAVPWFTVDGDGPTFAVQPGDTLYADPMSFGYVRDLPGTYRFVFAISKDSRRRKSVAERLRVSPVFELRM